MDLATQTIEEQFKILSQLESRIKTQQSPYTDVATPIRNIEKSFADFKESITTKINSIKEATPVVVTGKAGKDGKDGVIGRDGRDGKQGVAGTQGDQGIAGTNGVSVVNASIAFDNHLVITLSDGSEIDAGEISVINNSNVTQVVRNQGEQTMTYTLRYDQIDSTLAYKGEAIVGASETVGLWRIQKMVFGVDGDVTTTWASGTVDFRFKWSDRLTLTYS